MNQATTKKNLLAVMILSIVLSAVFGQTAQAAESNPGAETVYVTIEPYLTTNFVKKNGRLSFLSTIPRIVTSKDDEALVDRYMPMIKDFMVEYLSALPEEMITNPSQRPKIQKENTAGLQKLFEQEVGKKVVTGVLFKKFLTM